MKFKPNNIGFRVVSSKCIEVYKNAQGFALSEVSRRSIHTFSKTSREILLLEYDVWFRWLIEVEALLKNDGEVKESTKKAIVELSDVYTNSMERTISTHPEVFDSNYVNVWRESYKLVHNYMKKEILLSTASDISGLMSYVTAVILAVLNTTLHELYEIDTLVYTQDLMFISICDICVSYKTLNRGDNCLLLERLEVYRKTRNFGDSIIVKNYLDTYPADKIKRLTDAGYSIIEVQ